MCLRLLLSLSFVLTAANVSHASAVSWDPQSDKRSGGADAFRALFYDYTAQRSVGIEAFADGYEDLLDGPTSIAATDRGIYVAEPLAVGNASQFPGLNTASEFAAGAEVDLLPGSITVQGPPGGGDTVPEPATFGLIAAVACGFIGARLRRRHKVVTR